MYFLKRTGSHRHLLLLWAVMITFATAGIGQTARAAGTAPHTNVASQMARSGRMMPTGKAISPQALPAPTVVGTHPRIWLTPDRLAHLKVYAARNTALWQQVKAKADAALSYQPTAVAAYDGAGGLPDLGLAYQVTGNPAYAQKAIQILGVVCVPSNTIFDQEANGWYFRSVMPDVTAGYDWCYALIPPAQRTVIASWLMDRAYQCWPETAPARAGGWAIADPTNNYFWGMMSTWPAALAAYGDDPRAATEIQYSLTRHYSLVVPFSQGWGQGGAFAEGSNYDSLFNMALVYDAHRTATGQDFFNDPSFTFLKNSLLWRIHSAAPGEKSVYYWGNQTRVNTAPLFDMDFLRGVIVADNVSDSTLAGYGQNWLNTILGNGSVQMNAGSEGWEFLFYNPDAPSADYTQSLPTAYFDAGTGLMVNRSDWSANATYWGTWAGPLQTSHQFNDVNGFVLWKGSYWLTGSCNMWGYSGLYGASDGQNTLTFGGGQYQQMTQTPTPQFPLEAGWVLKQEAGADYTYSAGQGANAYTQRNSGGGTPVATDFVRKIVHLGPDTFIIYDRATVVNPDWSKEWHLQSQKPITINGRSYCFDNGQYQVSGQSLLPAAGTTLQSVPCGVGTDGTATSYRLDVDTDNAQATDYLLNVLQVTPVGQPAAFQAQTLAGASANVDAVQCGSWVVTLGRSEKITTPVTYTAPSGGPLQHLALDLVPGLHYTVALKSIAAGAVTSTVLTASASGSLRFSSAGGVQVSISTSNVVPCSISGRVYSIGTAAGVGGTTVSAGGQTAQTDLSGQYTITGLTPGTYTVTPAKDGLLFSAPRTVTVGPDATGVDFGGDTSQETYHVNSGGDNFIAADGTYWLSDRFFQGGVAHTYPTVPIMGSRDPGLMYDVLNSRGDFKYVFPAVAGGYTVKVHFLETDNSVTGPGQRLFSVTVNGAQALTNYDVYADVGPNVAVTKSIPASAGPDGVEVDFHTVKYAAMVSSIELVPSGATAPATYTISGTVTSAGKGLTGVALMAGGQSAVTAPDGTYTLGGLAAGTYAVNAGLSGYALSGPQSVTVGPNKNGVNFTATQNAPTVFSISGTVTSQGAALAGATVSAGSQSAATAADGSYRFTGLTAGSYSVSAGLSGYVISAPQSVTVGPSQIGVNFQAVAVAAPSSVLRVNCGGGAYTDASGAAWQADASFSGGATWTFPASGLAGTPDPALYGTVRYDDAGFGYRLPAPAGAYTLRLHFVEGDASKAAPGARAFDVAVNGAPALTGLDVCAAAGGVGRPLVESIPVTSDGGGVAVAFTARASSAMVSAIELVPANPPPPVGLRINCGGGAYTDASGAAWQADASFSGGATWTFPASGLAGTPDPALYGTVRYDDAGFGYRLPAPAGAYTLRLHFVEGDASKAAPGARAFDVAVNGAPALTGLDVCAAAGGVGRPLVESIPVTSDGGGVAVAFTARASSAMVSAIELVPATGTTK